MAAIQGPCDSNAWLPDAVERLADLLGSAPGPSWIPRILRRGGALGLGGCWVYASTPMATTYLVQTVHERFGDLLDDVEVTTTHWRWDGEGDPGPTDFETVESRLDGFWTAIIGIRSPWVRVSEHRWYPMPPSAPNPAIRVTPVSITGESTSPTLPPQVASTITQITDVRRRWGRFYIGSLSSAAMTAVGRLTASARQTIAEAGEAAFVNSSPVWRLQVYGQGMTPESLPVREVMVDDVFDVQRRRRFEVVMGRTRLPLDTP